MSMRNPPLTCETRWSSQQATIKYSIDNWRKIVSVIFKQLPVNDELNSYSEVIQLKRGAAALFGVLNPVSEALNFFKKNNNNNNI